MYGPPPDATTDDPQTSLVAWVRVQGKGNRWARIAECRTESEAFKEAQQWMDASAEKHFDVCILPVGRKP